MYATWTDASINAHSKRRIVYNLIVEINVSK